MRKDELETLMAKTVSDWYENLEAQDYETKIKRQLTSCYDSLVLNLLGFKRDNWGNKYMEVDHCNGRAGESFVGSFVKAKAAAEANRIFEIAFERLDPDKLVTNEMLEALEEQFKEDFKRSLRDRVRQLAERKASEVAEDVVAMLVPETIEVPAFLVKDAKLRLTGAG